MALCEDSRSAARARSSTAGYTILGVGYMVSRGLAKSGAGAAADTNDHRGGGAPMGERVKAAAEALSGYPFHGLGATTPDYEHRS